MYKRVLLATDFDEIGIHAAHKAKKIADESDAKLFLVHVVEAIPAYAYSGFAGFAEVEISIREQAEKELAELAKKLDVDKKHQLLEFGSIKNEVLRVAQENKIDLLVTGTHGKHGLSLLLGSTSVDILRDAQCDVLIVRAKDK